MKDATIENKKPVYEQENIFPSIVDTDDIIIELGKQVITKINNEKLLKSILQKVQSAEAVNSEIGKERNLLLSKMEALSSSNKLYEENNRKLSDSLVTVRKSLSDKEKQFVEITNTLNNERAVFETEKQKAIDDKSLLIKKYQAEIEALVKEKDKSILDNAELIKKITPKKKAKKAKNG